MKRLMLIVVVALAFAGIGWAGYRAASPPEKTLSKFVPAGSVLYLEAKDFSSLLSDWNSSPQKRQWIQSDSYEVFSRSHLFLRLKGASDQFAAAAGLPPDMDFLTQVAGEHSVFALYDIGKLQFLYIAYLPSAKSMQTTLWQTRSKFEPRNAGGIDFYIRRDPESQREVAFAVAGDYLVLATREDLMAGALQLISGKQDRTVESDPWFAQSTAAAGSAGDLRMVLDLQTLVPNGYFRTYWVQENITDLSQYTAVVSDLFRSNEQYREERVLVRKKAPQNEPSEDAQAAAANLSRLVPDDAGVYVSTAGPTPDACLALLETKLLAPHLGPAPASQIAPNVQLTSGETGSSADLETRIDLAPDANQASSQSASELKLVFDKTPILASLQVQSTQRDAAGVFVRVHSAVVLASASNWSEDTVRNAVASFVQPAFTASRLGVGWAQKNGYAELDGLWPLALSVHEKYLIVSDDPALMRSMLASFGRNSSLKPLQYVAGFNHQQERGNFARFTRLIDRVGVGTPSENGAEGQPQFFSGNMASLSTALAAVSAERIEIRSEEGKVRQTVTYEWSQ
jgi:hypothetical protein